MERVRPLTLDELAAVLREAPIRNRRVRLGGAFSKDAMAGPLAPADVSVSLAGMNRVLQYEPKDLTISVEAGMLWSDLVNLLAANAQMIPLDPPFFHTSTVGGVVAGNLSGPRRRLYGSARDMIIGMKFVTLEGKVVQSGGMVVKNVAGLDMAKLMIGSFGTLAAIGVVNFKLAPLPPATRTFAQAFESLDAAVGARDAILTGVLQPTAIDLLNPAASQRVRLDAHYTLLVQASGSPAVLDRYGRDLAAAQPLEGDAERALWTRVREFTPSFLAEHPEGGVIRYSTTLTGIGEVLARSHGPAVARAGTGVVYVYVHEAKKMKLDRGKAAVEFAPEKLKPTLDLWPNPSTDFDTMIRIKKLFDPQGLLNRGRLYGRI